MSKGGRPALNIDWKLFENLCHIGCTREEISHMLGVSKDTLFRACKKTHGVSFDTLFKTHFSKGKTSLRRQMLKMALDGKGNTAMCIFLSKQWLGMSDKVEHTHDELPARPDPDL